MKKNIACLALLVAACVIPAFAVAPDIVYVSYNGSDASPCSRTAPCHTITHALTVVAATGVVDIIASGNYDAFTVTKAVTVGADSGVSAVIVPVGGSTAVTINAGSADVVNLDNLVLQDSFLDAGNGVAINSAAAVNIHNLTLRNFNNGISLPGSGSSSSAINVSVTDTSVDHTATAIVFDDPAAAGAFERIRITSGGRGVYIFRGRAELKDSVVTGLSNTAAAVGSELNIENSLLSNNATGVGINSGAVVRLSNCTIVDNQTGVFTPGGGVFSRRNNTIENNTADVNGTLTPYAAK